MVKFNNVLVVFIFIDIILISIGIMIPISNKIILLVVFSSVFISSDIRLNEPIISPAKSDVIAKGIIFINSFIVINPMENPIPIPNIIGSKNKIDSLNFFVILLKLYSILSYSLNMIAIAEPLIPGIIIPKPINTPNINFFKVSPII